MKFIFGISASLYVIGFCVHSIHLANFGIVSTDLARAQYILAGAWVVVPLAIGAGTTLLVGSIVIHWDEFKCVKDFVGKYKWDLTILLMVGIASVVVMERTSLKFLPALLANKWPIIPLSLLSGSVITLTYYLFSLTAKEDIRRNVSNVLLGLSLVILLVIDILGFSNQIYPYIPLSFGGGKPAQAHFLIKPEFEKVYSSLLKANCRDKQLEVGFVFDQILTTDDSYFVRICARAGTLEIPRNVVDGVWILDGSAQGSSQ